MSHPPELFASIFSLIFPQKGVHEAGIVEHSTRNPLLAFLQRITDVGMDVHALSYQHSPWGPMDRGFL